MHLSLLEYIDYISFSLFFYGESSSLMKLSSIFLIAPIENKEKERERRKGEKFSNSCSLIFTHHQDLIVFCFLLCFLSLKRLAICIENDGFVQKNSLLLIRYVGKQKKKENQFFFSEKYHEQSIQHLTSEERSNQILVRHSGNLTGLDK